MIFEKAKELAKEITLSKEYKELVDSKYKLDEDKAAKKLMEDMIALQKEYVKTIKENLDKDTMKSMENILKNKHQEVLENNVTHTYIKARENFDKFMKEINNTISEGIKI